MVRTRALGLPAPTDLLPAGRRTGQLGRVHNECFWITDEILYQRTSQGLQIAPEPLRTRRWSEEGCIPARSREQVREEALHISQKGALTLDTPQLLEESQRQELGVGETLYGLVALSAWVEEGVEVSSMRHNKIASSRRREWEYAADGPSAAPLVGGRPDGSLSTPNPRNRHLEDTSCTTSLCLSVLQFIRSEKRCSHPSA